MDELKKQLAKIVIYIIPAILVFAGVLIYKGQDELVGKILLAITEVFK